jgi:hypothetical protein
MEGWTTAELQEVGTDTFDISSVNMVKLYELLSELFVKVVLANHPAKSINHSQISVKTSVDMLHVIEFSYKGKLYGSFICSKESMLDPLRGIFSVLFEPVVEFHDYVTMEDMIDQEDLEEVKQNNN